MFFNKPSLSMKGKYNLRAVLAKGPLRSIDIDEIQDNQLIAAAAIDTYTMIVQNCKSVTLFDCLNDTIKIPEIIVRNCIEVIFPSVIECTIMTIHNSTLKCNGENTTLHIDGDVVITEGRFEGYKAIKVNGVIYCDSMSLSVLETMSVSCSKTIDLGDTYSVNNEASKSA